MRKYLFDTNALLNKVHLLDEPDEIVIPYVVLEELDRLKVKNDDLGYRARHAVRLLRSKNNVTYDSNAISSVFDFNDNVIIESARNNGCVLVTGDYLIELKARSMDVEVLDIDEETDDDYSGYLEVKMSDEELAHFYENPYVNQFNLLTNQYLIISDKNEQVIEIVKWNGSHFDYCNNKSVNSSLLGKFKVNDAYQQCALDSLLHNQMTMIKGKAGSGKSLIALNYAMSQLEKGKYDKLIIIVNPLNSRSSAKLGFYPGSRDEKLMDSFLGAMLASKFGDKIIVERMIADGKLLLLPTGDIRGFDTTNMKAIVYICEAQNMSIDLMKLAIQRVGDDSKLIIDGDYKQQVDSYEFEGKNNGMRRVSEIFRGQDFYGEVELKNIYRSKMASVADLM